MTNKERKRLRKLARARGKVQALVRPITVVLEAPGTPTAMARRAMQQQYPDWTADWATAGFLEATIAHLDPLCDDGYSLGYVAREFRQTLLVSLESILSKYRSQPIFPQDWYKTSSRQPQDVDRPSFGMYAGIHRH